jgi:hypothetical protein
MLEGRRPPGEVPGGLDRPWISSMLLALGLGLSFVSMAPARSIHDDNSSVS